MRGVAIGRRNYLFAGTDSGREPAAGIYSLIGTVKLGGINSVPYCAIQVHASRMLIPLLEAVPSLCVLAGPPRKHPGKLHDDKAYASHAHRAWLRTRGIAPRIARYGIESRERLGKAG